MKTPLASIVALCHLSIAGYSATLSTSTSEFGLPIELHTTEIDETGTLSKFDKNLGTLTGATLIIYTGAQFSFSASNGAAQTQKAIITPQTFLDLSSGEPTLNSLIQAENPTIFLKASSGLVNFAVGQTINYGPVSASEEYSYNLDSVLSAVQEAGGGNFTINAVSLSGISVQGGGGNISTTQTTQAGVGAKIIYSYIAVPEPSSSFLALTAVFGLCLRRKR